MTDEMKEQSGYRPGQITSEFTKEQPGSTVSSPVMKLDFKPGPSQEEMKKFQGPESKRESPDVRMQLTGSTPEEAMAAGGDPEQMAEYLASLERGYGAQEKYESGRGMETTLARHHKPETIIEAIRLLQRENEKSDTGGELGTDWDVGRQAGLLKDRKICLREPFERLVEMEWLRELNGETIASIKKNLGDFAKKAGKDELSEEDIKKLFGIPEIGGFGIRTFHVPSERKDTYKKDKDGNIIEESITYRSGSQEVTYYGTPKEKEEFSKVCETGEKEFYVRNLLKKNKSHYLFFREALNKIVELYFGPVSTSEGISILFNLPFRKGETKKSISGSEFRNFGDKIEMAKRLYYINALCQKPHRFNDLMTRPGWEDIVFPVKHDEKTDRDKLINEFIGKPKEWVQEPYQDPSMPGQFETSLGTKRSRETLKVENGYIKNSEGVWKYDKENDNRGRLTRRNIFAESSPWDIELDKAIQEFLGGGEDESKVNQEAAADAQALGYWEFKLWLNADNEGYEIYKDDSMPKELGFFGGRELQFENGPGSSDFSKLTFPSGYNLKNKRRHLKAPHSRDYGPEGSFGKIPRFCTDFLRLIATPVEVNGEVLMIKGEPQLLSFNEQWWGYPEDEKNELPRVPAKRIGELPWTEAKFEKISREDAEITGLPMMGISDEALPALYLTTYMGGRSVEANGAYAVSLQTDLRELKPLEDPGHWLKLLKAVDVGIKNGVAVNGEFRGKTKKEVADKRKAHIQAFFDAYWEGIRSTVDYQRAYDKKEVFAGWFGDKPVPRYKYIMAIAKKAGVKLVETSPIHGI